MLLEIIKLEGVTHTPEEAMVPSDVLLLQLCSGMDENTVGTCAELIFAPIDASFTDDAPLLPSGFRIIPLDHGTDFASLQGGICLSSMGRPVSYDRAVAWKVLNEDDIAHCICFIFVNWSFV
ncbi:hypothetical protein OROGR_005035 [Orobanche gracilis]